MRHLLPAFLRKLFFALLPVIAISFAGCGPKFQLTPLEPAAPPVMADSGMVVAAHPLAAEAGLAVLKEGGNAVDAAIAALFALNVVEPHASGLGGGGFALVKMVDEEPVVINFRERAPRGVDTAFYYNPSDSLSHLRHGATSVCVPGAAAGWGEMLSRWGTFPLERLSRDGIKYAEVGFPINPGLSRLIADNLAMISSDTNMAAVFLRDSLPPAPGDTLRQTNLAKTFKEITARGLNSFYRGPIAEAVVEAVRADSGYMNLNDLEFYRVEIDPPIKTEYRGVTIYTIPPPSAGGATLIESLNLIAHNKATSAGMGKFESVHLMGQCINQAYADAEATIGDPEFVKRDWRRLLTPAFASSASSGISVAAKAAQRTPVVVPATTDHGNTTHLVVIDRWGNMVSLTQSINYFFGAGVMAGSTGILLNNQAADFSAPPDSLNLIAPRHRPRSNMAPVLAIKDGKPFIAVGTPGGGRIPSTVTEILVNIIDGGMNISGAIDYPRFFPAGEFIVMENRYPIETMKGLHKLGYKIPSVPPYHYYFGGAHGIMVSPDGKLSGSADKRRGGAARGY